MSKFSLTNSDFQDFGEPSFCFFKERNKWEWEEKRSWDAEALGSGGGGSGGGPGRAGQDWLLCMPSDFPSDSVAWSLVKSASPPTSGTGYMWEALGLPPSPQTSSDSTLWPQHSRNRGRRSSSWPSLPRQWFWDQSEACETAPQRNNQKQKKEPLIVPTLKKWGCF